MNVVRIGSLFLLKHKIGKSETQNGFLGQITHPCKKQVTNEGLIALIPAGECERGWEAAVGVVRDIPWASRSETGDDFKSPSSGPVDMETNPLTSGQLYSDHVKFSMVIFYCHRQGIIKSLLI